MKQNVTLFILAILCLSSTIFGSQSQSSHRPPILTTAAIIEIYDKEEFRGIVLIERGKAPFGKALPGGKVEYGETVENAIQREMMEEVNLELEDLRQFHVYSDPARDFRHHSVEVTHLARSYRSPQAGDDAAQAAVYSLETIPWKELAFDHAQILKDCLLYREGDRNINLLKP